MSQPFHDTEGAPQMQLSPRLLDLWETEIVPQLPATLDEQARRRKRLKVSTSLRRRARAATRGKPTSTPLPKQATYSPSSAGRMCRFSTP